MKIIRSVRQMQSLSRMFQRSGKSVGFVPTMGALHEGHRSLIRRARAGNKVVVVSIFVNPAQFGPREDYRRYPRPLDDDTRVCRTEKVDYLFLPSPEEMYHPGHRTFVTVEKISEALCGAFRPGHFRGVATVVLKLFNIVRPERAYFGEKDYQQLKIIERMAADLNVPVTVVPCPTVREPSGLAMSSRNRYLKPREREASALISVALGKARDLLRRRRVSAPGGIVRAVSYLLRKIPGARIDYVFVGDPSTLSPLARVRLPVLVAVAVRVGAARLIDNIVVDNGRRRRKQRRSPREDA